MTTRPNMLLITYEQQRADCFGFENRHTKTPHINKTSGKPLLQSA